MKRNEMMTFTLLVNLMHFSQRTHSQTVCMLSKFTHLLKTYSVLTWQLQLS